jgi:Tfp pilus assembly protein PilV
VTAAAAIDLRRGSLSGLAARMRTEDGIGLIELLIALLVLNVGIFATLGAFTSAASTLKRSSRISTAAAIADQEIEALHNKRYSQIVNVAPTTWPSAQTPDGGVYTYQVVVSAGQVTGGSANNEQATVTVTSNADPRAKVTSITTFSRCTQSGLQGDTAQATPLSPPCQS